MTDKGEVYVTGCIENITGCIQNIIEHIQNVIFGTKVRYVDGYCVSKEIMNFYKVSNHHNIVQISYHHFLTENGDVYSLDSNFKLNFHYSNILQICNHRNKCYQNGIYNYFLDNKGNIYYDHIFVEISTNIIEIFANDTFFYALDDEMMLYVYFSHKLIQTYDLLC